MATASSVRLRDVRRLGALTQLLAAAAIGNFAASGLTLAAATMAAGDAAAIFAALGVANAGFGLWVLSNVGDELREVNP